MPNRRAWFWSVAGLFIVLYSIDRLTKLWALKELAGQRIALFPGLDLTLVLNEKFAYLSLPGWVAILVTVLVMALMAGLARQEYMRGHRLTTGLMFVILLGAWSNCVDRIRFGGVIDFLAVRNWSVFNLSDMYIVVGVVGLLLCMSKEKPAPSQTTTEPVDTKT